MFINGTQKAAEQGNIAGDCSRDRMVLLNINAGKMSGYFRGKVDEVRIWNTAITDISTLRNWMCRKVNGSHPKWGNLMAYYTFDIVDPTGKVAEKKNGLYGQLMNVTFSLYSNYESSGAPIGDDSRQIYPPNWNSISLSYTHPNGDRFNVTNLGLGLPEGVHIYMVNQAPTNNTPPCTAYLKLGSYYYGVFTANGNNATYKVIYNYQGNPDASNATLNNRLDRRKDNSDSAGWQNTGANLDQNTKTLSSRGLRESYKGEYIIGQRPTVNNIPGPGYAIQFNNSNASMYFNRPDDNWTTSYWYRPISGGEILGFWEAADIGATRFSIYSYVMSMISCRAGSSCTNSSFDYSTDMTGAWNYITLVKRNGLITVYMNGYEILTMLPGIGDDGLPNDVNMTKLKLGTLSGYIDELQVWDTAFSQNDIRTWMCRKVNTNPMQADHLLLHLDFNNGQGNLVENTCGPGDLELSGSYNWVASGAPIGDTSVFFYPAQVVDSFYQPGRIISIKHPDGDSLKVVMSSQTNWATIRGIQLYRVNGAAQFSTVPNPPVKSWDSTRYYGAFIIGVPDWGRSATI